MRRWEAPRHRHAHTYAQKEARRTKARPSCACGGPPRLSYRTALHAPLAPLAVGVLPPQMSATPRKCAVCAKAEPKRNCPNQACGTCCNHGLSHSLKDCAGARVPANKTLVCLKVAPPRLKRQKRRREGGVAAVLASARARADAAPQDATSPLLALPDTVLDAIFRALDPASPVWPARLACVHSVFLAAYCRSYRVYKGLHELHTALTAQVAGVLPPLPPASPLRIFVQFADLEEWPAWPVPALTLMHARVQSTRSEEYDDVVLRMADINGSVLLILELETKVGAFAMDSAATPDRDGCPWCESDDGCGCPGVLALLDEDEDTVAASETAHRLRYEQRLREHEAEEKAAYDECVTEAEDEARATLDKLRREGCTVPVRKLTLEASVNQPRYVDDAICIDNLERHEVGGPAGRWSRAADAGAG